MRILIVALLAVSPLSAVAGDPKCDDTNNWATNMAFVQLKNAGLVHSETTDFSKTSTTRVASQKIGKDLYRQVHHITFVETSGTPIEVIAVNDASHDECSRSGVEVYVISSRLGGLDK